MNKLVYSILFFLVVSFGYGQDANVLSFTEYLGYIKKYHPIVKQANLLLEESEAKLLQARGSFDPKLEVDYDRKKFKDIEYYDKLNASFKIPTWYGIEVIGNYEQNEGEFLNPEATVPSDGLFNVGISISVLQDLVINERMATLKQAKLYQKQAELDNQLLVNEILYKASKAYFNWLKSYQEKKVFEEFLENALVRFEGVKTSFELGERPAIDTTESRIAYNNRIVQSEKATLQYTKAALELSNFLWINDIPVEVQSTLIPDIQVLDYIDESLQLNSISLQIDSEIHPKLQKLDYKYKELEVDQRLKRNNLLPKVDLKYNFLSETPGTLNSFNTANYKAGLDISFPLFLRKERASLKLANYKLQAIEYDKQVIELSLKNKLNAVQQEIVSYKNQLNTSNTIVSDYSILLKGEERKFELGESSLFLINSRESKLIENKLKAIELESLWLTSKSKLFNVMGM